MQVKQEKVATLESTQFDKIIGRYSSAIKTFSLLKEYFNNITILDYGSGNGIFLRILQKNNLNAFGWEPSSELVKAVNIFQNIENNHSDIDEVKNKKFDVIVTLRTWAYIPNKKEVIKLWSDMLTDNGIVILENSNYNYWSKYRSSIPMYPGWNISKEDKNEFNKYSKFEKKLIGYSEYYFGNISDGICKLIIKKVLNNIDRFLGQYFTLFAPHYIYIYRKRKV